MIIKKLSLYGYNRLATSGIREINIIPSNKIILIVGTNGTGKSSLLRELSPLPAISQDYAKGGYKYIEIFHDNKTYHLLSEFSSPARHSFRINGEELNTSGTLQIQRELVKQHFNITPEVHDLMLGVKSFHRMSPKERNDWFNRLCSTDYTFAISFFNKLKEKLRDTQGALNLTSSKKMQEINKKEDIDKVHSYTIYKNQLEDQLATLHKLSVKGDPYNLDSNIKKYKTLIKEISEYTSSIYSNIKSSSIDSPRYDNDKITTKIRELEKLIDTNNGMLDAYGTDLNTLTQLQNEHNLSQLEQEYKEVNAKLSNPYTPMFQYKDSAQAFESIKSIKEQLYVYLSDMTQYNGKIYTKAILEDLTNKRRKCIELVNHHSSEVASISAKLCNIESVKTICPKCSYIWHRDINESSIEQLKNKLSTAKEDMNDKQAKLKLIEEHIEKCSSYMNTWNGIKAIMNGTPVLGPLWRKVLDNNLISTEPNEVKGIIERAEADLQSQLRIKELVDHKERIEYTMELIRKSGLQEVSLEERIKSIQSNIRDIYTQQDVLNKQLKHIRNIDLSYNDMRTKITELNTRLEESYSISKIIEETIESAKVSKLIDFVKKELDLVNAKINEAAINEQHLKYLEQEESTLKQHISYCKILQDAMSPKTGLLALGMSGFINDTLRRMNDIISEIWSYPLELLPCNIDEGENLDYRFPIRVGETTISDINIGSSAMKEIVDLSFRLVVMRYLGLDQYPVYIDELGASFDEKHRDAAFKLIRDMASSDEFSQLFLISHYSENYGSLCNIDSIVLSDTNITVSSEIKASTCCTITRD